MKNLTKVLAVVLALAMVFSMGSFAAFTDVTADASYGEAVSILSSLDILKGYEDGTFGPDKTITRAEFAAVICRLLGLGATAEGAKGQTTFSDVAADDWASGYIALASQQKIVNGIGDNKFAPEEPVKYEEAIKMIVAALGYTPMADVNGGYPGGYQVVAAQKGILASVKGGKQGEAATRAIVAQMSYNALEVPLMVQKGFGTETTYETGDQLLLNKLGIVKLEGAVDATSDSSENIDKDQIKLRYDKQVTAVDGQSTAQRYAPDNEDCNPSVDYSEDNGEFYNTVDLDTTKEVATAAKSLLDYNVVMYVRDADTDDAALVAIAKRGTRNQEVTFKSEDINDSDTEDNLSSGVLSKVVVYTDKDNDKDESYDLNIDKVYVNGRNQASDSTGTVKAGDVIDTAAEINEVFNYYANSNQPADIRLLCNETAGDEYNIAYITTYKDYVVESKTARTYTIMSKDSIKLVLDEEDEDFRFDIIKDGKKITFADIAENDVLSVAGYVKENKLQYGTVIVTSTQVTGKVTSYDDTDEVATIEGKDYDLNAAMVLKFRNKNIRLGDTVTMYMNARGVLVGVDSEKSKGTLKYGFATVVAKSSGINDTYQIRLMNTEGTWITYDFASKVTFNDEATSYDSKTYTLDNWAIKIGNVGESSSLNTVVTGTDKLYVNKVIAYETNSSEQISKVYFIPKTSTDDIFMANSDDSATYNESTESFGGVFVNDSTLIFSVNVDTIPVDAEVDDDDVSIAKKDALVDRDEYTNTKAYNLDDDSYAAVIYGKNIVGSIKWASNVLTVSGIATTTNEAGDDGINITGISGGETVTLFAADDTDVQKVVAYSGSDDIAKTNTLSGDTAATTDDVSTDSIEKGDVLIYSKNAKGEADKIIMLVDASDIMVSDSELYGAKSFKENPFGDTVTGTTLYSFESGTNDYKFIFGYAYELSSTRLSIKKNSGITDANAIVNLSVKASTTYSYYDAFYSTSGRTKAGDVSDITFDKTSDNEGDYVFARVYGDTIVEDMVIFKANNAD